MHDTTRTDVRVRDDPPTSTPGTRAGREGARDALGVITGYVPFALALGAALASSGVDPVLGWATSAVVFAGAAQLVTVELLGGGTGPVLVVVTALVVNVRHVLYSASMVPHVVGWRRRDRLLAAYFLVDPVWALALARFGGRTAPTDAGAAAERAAADRAYYVAMAVTCWTGWLVLTGAGAAAADALPDALPLDVATPLTFLLLLLPMLRGRAARTAAAAGGLAALVASPLPLGLGLLVGAAAGVGAGVVVIRKEASS